MGRCGGACLRAALRRPSPWGRVARAGRGFRGRRDGRRPPGPAVSPPAPRAPPRRGQATRGFRTQTLGTGRRRGHSPHPVSPRPPLVRSTETIAPSTGCCFDPTRATAYTHPRTKSARLSRLLDAANARMSVYTCTALHPAASVSARLSQKDHPAAAGLADLREAVSARVRRGTDRSPVPLPSARAHGRGDRDRMARTVAPVGRKTG